MEILRQGIKYPKEWVGSFTNMDKYAHGGGDFIYIEARPNHKTLESIKDKKIVYMDMEEPNRFFISDPAFRRDEYEWYFYKILTMCPFTAKWLNKRQSAERRIPIFYPVDHELAPPKTEKIYDVIYSGGLYSDWLLEDVKAMTPFKYNFIAHNGILSYKFIHKFRIIHKLRQKFPRWKFLEGGRRYITKNNIPHLEKWNIMSQTKITITHSIVPCEPWHAKNVYKTEGWEDNEAFSKLPRPTGFWRIKNFIDQVKGKTYLVPQLKSRAFEAALCRSLILCRRDPWNVIESYFEPGKEFVYYEPGKLEEKIREILSNWNSYEPIIENAYNKFLAEYSTKRYFEKFLRDLK